MVKIVLDAGHYLTEQLAYDPNGKSEWILNDKVCNLIKEQLKSYDCVIERIDDITGASVVNMATKCKLILSYTPDIFISIHHGNTMGGKWNNDNNGIYVATYRNSKLDSKSIAQLILNGMISNMTEFDYSNTELSSTDYLLCRNDDIPRLLINGPFITNQNEYDYAWSEECQLAYSTAISNAILSYFNPRTVLDLVIPRNINSFGDYETIVNANYEIKNIDGEEVAVQGNDTLIELSTIEKTTISEYYVIRKEFSQKTTQKFRTTNLSKAIDICNQYVGYKIFDNLGTLIYVSKKNKVLASKNVFSTKEISASIGVIGGGNVITDNNESILLGYGTIVYIIETTKDNYRIRFIYNGNTSFGYINKRFLKF